MAPQIRHAIYNLVAVHPQYRADEINNLVRGYNVFNRVSFMYHMKINTTQLRNPDKRAFLTLFRIAQQQTRYAKVEFVPPVGTGRNPVAQCLGELGIPFLLVTNKAGKKEILVQPTDEQLERMYSWIKRRSKDGVPPDEAIIPGTRVRYGTLFKVAPYRREQYRKAHDKEKAYRDRVREVQGKDGRFKNITEEQVKELPWWDRPRVKVEKSAEATLTSLETELGS